jgi:transmembrane sensor
MSRKVFHDLLQRYLDGSCTREEKNLVETWYLMLSKVNPPMISPTELHVIEEDMWNELFAKTSGTRSILGMGKSTGLKQWMVKSAIAASIGIFVVISAYVLIIKRESEINFTEDNGKYAKIEKINNTLNPLAVDLEDGSKVVLRSNASISYPRHFSERSRDVVLNGEAFFKVSKDKSRPFHVYHGHLKTTVLGTSFIIKNDNSNTLNEVVVLSGKVMVTEHERNRSLYDRLVSKKTAEVVLMPNQRAIYDKNNKGLVRTLVMKPMIVREESDKTPSSFIFNETSLSKVFADLQKAYSIEIIVNIPFADKCTFTGELETENLYTNLDLICKAIGGSYEIRDTRIYIFANKCN